MINRFACVSVSVCVLFLSACMGTMHSRDKPLRYDEAVNGNPVDLMRCVIQKLYADSRPSIQLYHYKSRHYPAIETAQVLAYDTRFLPYIYASNSPQNPDGIRDYISAEPEILPDDQVKDAEYVYAFALTIKKSDKTTSAVTLRGNPYISTVAWDYLKTCAASAD